MIKRVLCIISSLNQGGAETFLMKIYRKLNHQEFQMDFCVMSDIVGKYEDEVLDLGGHIYRVTEKSKNPVSCFYDIKRIVKENGYKSVIRINEHSLSVIDLLAAKSGGAKRLIMRSSNANSTSGMSKMLHNLFKFLPIFIPNVKIAPSDLAAEYTFGKRQIKKGRVSFLRNGIDIEEYSFKPELRKNIRKELKLENKYVVGHIGRFSEQKNHRFLIKVFEYIVNKNENAHLLLIGANGNMEQQIRKQVEDLKLNDNVSFLGNRSDVCDLMSAIDVLLFPSLYEGMPNVVIESQASGLPCIISDSITKEADITGLVEYVSLTKPMEFWAERVLSYSYSFERKNRKEDFIKNGYDINKVVEEFIKLTFEGIE